MKHDYIVQHCRTVHDDEGDVVCVVRAARTTAGDFARLCAANPDVPVELYISPTRPLTTHYLRLELTSASK